LSWLVAITRNDVADYISTLALVYVVLIFIRILITWIPRIPYNRHLSAVIQFVSDVTDPYLNVFRKVLPLIRIGPGAIDPSPIVATFVLLIVAAVASSLISSPG
jgi:YggT family protein